MVERIGFGFGEFTVSLYGQKSDSAFCQTGGSGDAENRVLYVWPVIQARFAN